MMQHALELKSVQDQQAALAEREAYLKEQIRALMRDGTGNGPTTSVQTEIPVSDAVVSVLDLHQGTAFTPDQVAAQLKLTGHTPDMDSLRSTMARLAKKGRIAKDRRGVYHSMRPGARSAPESTANLHPPAVDEEVGSTH